jgi:hypothetical protein
VAVAVLSDVAPDPGAPGGGHPAPVASVLVLITVLGFCPTIYLSAAGTAPRDSRDWALPKVSWPVALPFYLLGYALAAIGLYSSLSSSDSLFVSGGDPLSAIQYAVAVLGFAVVGILRSRATSVHAPLSAAAATVLCLPLGVSALLLARSATRPLTVPVIELALMVVLIPALGCLAHQRSATAPLATVAATVAPTVSA